MIIQRELCVYAQIVNVNVNVQLISRKTERAFVLFFVVGLEVLVLHVDNGPFFIVLTNDTNQLTVCIEQCFNFAGYTGGMFLLCIA